MTTLFTSMSLIYLDMSLNDYLIYLDSLNDLIYLDVP